MKKDIEAIVAFLNNKFKEDGVNFYWEYDTQLKKFLVVCDNFDTYMFSLRLSNWKKILYKKYPSAKWFMCYLREPKGKKFQNKEDKQDKPM